MISKIFLILACPHCSKQIVTSQTLFAPILNQVFKTENVEEYKNKVRTALNFSLLPEELKQEIRNQLNNPEFILDTLDMEMMIKRISSMPSAPSNIVTK